MTEAERYLQLGLRLGRHVDGLVDSYYGPAELKAEADAGEPIAPKQLATHADALQSELPDGWLRDQVAGLATYARLLAGEQIAYSDEVEACYGVRPTWPDTSVYEAVHARLDELLPGDGSLVERHEAWRTAHVVPAEELLPVLVDVFAEVRRRTRDLFGLPEGEEMTVEEVRDEPWWAFSYYLGDLRSRIVVNTDIPTTFDDVLELAAHEGHPGHHTESALKEQLLVLEGGLLEETIKLVPTPQSVVAEGIAETAAEVLGTDTRAAVLAILLRHGIEYDAGRAAAIHEAFVPLRRLGLDAALLIHENGGSVREAEEYLMRWGVMSRERAQSSVRFVVDPNGRAYVISYSAGGELARAFHRNDPARFRRLLTEQIRVCDLADGSA